MKNYIRCFATLAAAALAIATASAQTTQKILVIDLAKVHDNHYKTAEQTALIQADQKKAVEELQRREQELNAMATELKEMEDQLKNPVTTDDAKKKLQEDGSKKAQEFQNKRRDAQAMNAELQRLFQQRIGQFNAMLMEEITKVAGDVAKRKGATFLFDKSGPSGIGAPIVVYADPTADITDEVMAEINASKPVSSAPTAAPAAATPAITVPGAKK